MAVISTPISVGIIGCGLIGGHRAHCAQVHSKSKVKMIADIDPAKAAEFGKKYACESTNDWKQLISNPAIQLVTISVPNGAAVEIVIAALKAGKHVLVEKPMGRHLAEAEKIASEAKRSKQLLKIGFNHRYHPAICKALEFYKEGIIGKLINIRARYGHGGRLGYEKEWRSNPGLAGGGELIDQGIHIFELIHAFAGLPQEAFAWLQTAIWPIQPLEDNGFGLFKFSDGMIASMHTSWTQWKNLFSFEVFGEKGSLIIEGLGSSYGKERLQIVMRNVKKGIPDIEEIIFDDADTSWELEWKEFLTAIEKGTSYSGTYEDGVCAMRMLDALYRSARHNGVVKV